MKQFVAVGIALVALSACNLQPKGSYVDRFSYAMDEQKKMRAEAKTPLERMSMVYADGPENTHLNITWPYFSTELARMHFLGSSSANTLWEKGFKRITLTNGIDHWSADIKKDRFVPDDPTMR